MTNVRYISERIIPLDKGDYQDGHPYSVMDMVTHRGSTYISKIDNNISAPYRNSPHWRLIAQGGNSGGSSEQPGIDITIDSALSEASPNPVQNKVIATEFAKQQSSLEKMRDDIKTLNGDGEGSVSQKILEAINAFATQLTNDGTVNTFAELLNYIAEHGADFTALVGEVSKIANNIEDVNVHIGTPDDDANKDGSIYARIANLIAIVSESTGGSTESIESQINTAIRAIVGELSDDDAKTLEVINDELNELQRQINDLSEGDDEFEQVQSDWNETDNTKPSYIKNKPTIPSEVNVDATLSTTSTNAIQNKVVTNELNRKQPTISDLDSIRSGASKGATAVQPVEGKGLSSEDFTTELKNKLNSLSNYDDSKLRTDIASLQQSLNTLLNGNASNAIESFNEIIAFLDGVKDNEDLPSIIASIEQQIAGKQNAISDLEAIRQGASKGMTAIQEHQSLANYATKTDVTDTVNNSIDKELSPSSNKAISNAAVSTKFANLEAMIGGIDAALTNIIGEEA